MGLHSCHVVALPRPQSAKDGLLGDGYLPILLKLVTGKYLLHDSRIDKGEHQQQGNCSEIEYYGDCQKAFWIISSGKDVVEHDSNDDEEMSSAVVVDVGAV